jgi:superfamily II DNA/RNA helicase
VLSHKATIQASLDPLVKDMMDSQRQQSRQREPVLSAYEKKLEDMTVRDWRIIREDFDIRCRGGRVPNPLRTFAESTAVGVPSIHPDILHAIKHTMGHTDPSPIQRQAIPIGLQRRDMIGER